MKLCKDCKHFEPIVGYALCDHPSVKHSSIDGSAVTLCQLARGEGYGACGPEAKLFEQKPPKEPPEESPKKRSLWVRVERFLAPFGNSGYLGRRP